MKTVLVPIDFSQTSLNAATYAVKMFTGVYGINMLLYHVCERPENMASAERELLLLKEKLFDIGIVKMQIACEIGDDLIDNIERLSKEKPVDMIVMGITGKTKMAQTFIGSNTLKVVKRNLCPVLIVPPGAIFNQLKNISLASDFTNEPSAAANALLKKMLSSHYATLHIVNVSPENVTKLSEKDQKARDKMDKAFTGFQHAFHFVGLYNFPDTMNIFVNDHHIDIIATLPKDHTWLSTLFGGSNTKKLAYQSSIPVLAIH